MESVSTLLVDASRLFREGLRHLLEGTIFRIEGEAATIDEALAWLARNPPPQLVLVEFEEGPSEPFAQVERLRAAYAGKIVVLTNRLSSRALAQALEAGADGYLLKNMSTEALMHSLSLVFTGEKVFPTQLAGLLVGTRTRFERTASQSSAAPSGLSEREAAILRCLVRGYPNKVIADHLQITEASVKLHLKTILRKIQVSNRTQAAIWAINHGFQGDQAGESD
ncbi:MAG TPA: response regulator transcription factor [Alphaproteobacteria bacterium]